MLGAIVTMNEKHQSHYDAHCPRCRRANSISRQRMELFFPNWQDAAKQLASTPPPKAETDSLNTEPVSKATKAAVEKKTVAKKPAAAKAPVAKKTAVKKVVAKTAEPKAKKK
jgi:hypothetical protein